MNAPREKTSARITDLEVYRAAKQLIDQFPGDPEFEASMRADSALEQGDLFNFDLWQRIAKAVGQLLTTRPQDPGAIN